MGQVGGSGVGTSEGTAGKTGGQGDRVTSGWDTWDRWGG